MTSAIGRPLERIDGRVKVTGAARYTADAAPRQVAYAVVVGARVASGRVSAMDAGKAGRAPGVLAVFTQANLPRVTVPPLFPSLFGRAAPGQTFFPMQDDQVHYAGQPVALVVADSAERARHAATLLRIEYQETRPTTVIDQARDQAYVPERIFGGLIPGRSGRGDVDAGLAAAEVRIDATYLFAANHHNPIEISAATAEWDDGRLLLHDTTQGITATQMTVAALLGIPPADVRVTTQFVGGGFGCKAMIWHHSTLAALAARELGRPVKLVLTREQMFSSCGHREEQEQRVVLGATRDGRLTAIRHHKISVTSAFDDWAEPSLGSSAQAYACPSYEGVYRLIRGNTMTPTFTRGPGESTGMFALECAMDELAYAVGVDPIELRLRNHADVDPERGQPWSSKGLKECYHLGVERFGWNAGRGAPGSRRDGHWLIGTGMATATYPVPAFPGLQPQRARARIYADGNAVVECALQEFGTGAVTAMTQVAADFLGVPVERVRFVYGDTDLPNASAAVGSAGSAMQANSVRAAALALREQLVAMAVADPRSPLHGAEPGAVLVEGGRMVRGDRSAGETYAELLQRHSMGDMDAVGSWNPTSWDTGYALTTFGAQFAEVAVDADLGVVRVRRMLGVFAPGRVLNPRTARSQLMGGMLWGLGQALLEGTLMDARTGRWANASLGEYLVPVNADAPDVEVEMIEVEDDVVNPLGVKGVGEIGQVGAAAAIANAVFHATGRRVRTLPIRIEHLL
jgi:xanthine dehydrogenase YagR molybdenum-binding subunit